MQRIVHKLIEHKTIYSLGMDNWIFGAADRTRQHDADMAFTTIKFTGQL